MKLGLVTKLYKKNKTTSKKIEDVIMLTIYDDIVIFPIYDQFEGTRKPDPGCIVCETYIFINSNLLSCKIENKTKKPLTQSSHYCFE